MAINSKLICIKAMRLHMEIVPEDRAVRVSATVKT